MKGLKRGWPIVAVVAMLLTPLVMLGAWMYQRGAVYRAAAASLPAELRAAKAEGLPLSPADLERADPVEDEQNAAILYVQLAGTGILKKDRDDIYEVAAGRGTDAQKRSARRFLPSAANQFLLVEQAAALPHCDFHRNWRLGPDLLLSEYKPMRTMARLLAARAELECEDGHPEAALRTIRTGARMAHHLDEEPILIATLVRVALEAIMERPLLHIIKKCAGRPEILRLALQTDQAFGGLPDVRHGLSGEVVMCRIMAAEIHPPDSDPEVMLAAVTNGTSQTVVADAFEARSLSFWRRTFTALKQAGDDPMAQYRALKAADDAEEAVSTWPNGKAKPTYEMNEMLSPYFNGAAEKLAEMEARRRVRRTLIALLQFRAGKGHIPAALCDLAPEVPVDPMIGKPLHYRVTSHGFVLYSVGRNLVDDGGNATPKKKGDPPPDIVASFP